MAAKTITVNPVVGVSASSVQVDSVTTGFNLQGTVNDAVVQIEISQDDSTFEACTDKDGVALVPTRTGYYNLAVPANWYVRTRTLQIGTTALSLALVIE